MSSVLIDLFQRLTSRVGGPQLMVGSYQGKPIVTQFDPQATIPLIDPTDWTSGTVTNLGKGEPYDPTKPFLPQYFALCQSVARPWLIRDPQSVASPWAIYDLAMNEAYGTYAGAECERVSYLDFCIACHDCADCLGCIRLQNSYECVQCVDGDYLVYCERCEDAFELLACRDCRDCHDCVGCVGLSHKSYCWFNEQLTEEEFRCKKAQLDLASRNGINELLKQFKAFSNSLPISAGRLFETEKSEGDDLAYTTNIRGISLGSCVDVYEAMGVAMAERCDHLLLCQKIEDSRLCLFCVECSRIEGGICLHSCSDILLGELLIDCQSCIGCIGLRHASYAILNHTYDKETYLKLAANIREELSQVLSNPSRWNELFPYAASPYAYSTSLANTFFPLNRIEAVEKQFRWYELEESQSVRVSGQETALLNFLRLAAPGLPVNERRKRRYKAWGNISLEKGTCDRCKAEISYRPKVTQSQRLCTNCFEQAISSDKFLKDLSGMAMP